MALKKRKNSSIEFISHKALKNTLTVTLGGIMILSIFFNAVQNQAMATLEASDSSYSNGITKSLGFEGSGISNHDVSGKDSVISVGSMTDNSLGMTFGLPGTVHYTNYSYSPLSGQSTSLTPDEEKIRKDIRDISKISKVIRIFDVGPMLIPILDESQKNSLKVAIGINLTSGDSYNYAKIRGILESAKRYEKTVDSIILGNNEILDKILSVDQIRAYVKYVKDNSDFKVTSINTPDVWLTNKNLSEDVDFIMFDAFTMYKTSDTFEAVQLIKKNYDTLTQAYPGKLLVLETGWSTVDSSSLKQRQFLDELHKTNMHYFLFEYSGELWKQNQVEKGFGIVENTLQSIEQKDDDKAMLLPRDSSHHKQDNNFLLENLQLGDYEITQIVSGKQVHLRYTDPKNLVVVIDNENTPSDISVKKVSGLFPLSGFIFAFAYQPLYYIQIGGVPINCDRDTNCIVVKFTKDEPWITASNVIPSVVSGVSVSIITAIIAALFARRNNQLPETYTRKSKMRIERLFTEIINKPVPRGNKGVVTNYVF